MKITNVVLASMMLLPSLARAEDCPAVVTAALKKAFADGTIKACSAHAEKTGKQFEAKVARGAIVLEVDVSPAGAILMVEESVAISDLPAAVGKAFAARYPKAKATKAEKMTAADGSVRFEVAFRVGTTTKEATFEKDGTFVEEE